MKLCVRCEERPEHISANGKPRSWCSPCLNKSNYITKANNPDKYLRQRRNAHLIKKYHITMDEYEQLLIKQGGGCAICGKSSDEYKSLAVDHDATTKAIRGILCENCNRAIGMLGHDYDRILRAAEYLRE